MTAIVATPKHSADATLFAAEQKRMALKTRFYQVNIHDPARGKIHARISRVEDVIATLPAATPAGAALKLAVIGLGNDSGAIQRAFVEIDGIAPPACAVADPVPAFVAEYFRFQAEAASSDADDEEKFADRLNEADKLTDPIEQQIADTSATSASGLCAQLWYLVELLAQNAGCAYDDGRDDRLFRSIVIGIMQLRSRRPARPERARCPIRLSASPEERS